METKTCTICKQELPKTTEFFATRVRKGIISFQSNCRKCQKEYRREHYLDNKEKYILKAKNYNKNIRDWLKEYKKTLKCSICGEERYWTLEFHHKNPSEKESNISMVTSFGSKRRLEKEIDKCIVVCANCHRDIHYKERLVTHK